MFNTISFCEFGNQGKAELSERFDGFFTLFGELNSLVESKSTASI